VHIPVIAHCERGLERSAQLDCSPADSSRGLDVHESCLDSPGGHSSDEECQHVLSKLFIKRRNGLEEVLEGRTGLSLMEIMRHDGIEELLAICGGCCSCATCHIFVDEKFFDVLPKMKSAEDDLLDSSDHRRPNSRLACQIPYTSALEGLRLTIAPED
jgi:ferredoxin, 2Fe-2S